jgi:uncharacterized protein YbaP (TraB family)
LLGLFFEIGNALLKALQIRQHQLGFHRFQIGEGVDAAFDSADRVILEISNPDDQAAIQPLIQQYGISPARPLSSLLTPAEIAQLDAAAGTIGATAAQLDPLRPWLVGLSLSIAPLVKAGYDPQSGVELILKARAEARATHPGARALDELTSRYEDALENLNKAAGKLSKTARRVAGDVAMF